MLRWLAATLVALAVATPSSAALAAPPTPPVGPTTPTTINPDFYPANQNLSDCRSGVPRPNCGSAGRGGWRQGLVFGAVAVGMAAVGWQVVRAARRRT